MLGVIYHHDGKFTNAIESFSKAIHINPDYTEATLHLAILYNDLGEYQKAKQLYREVHKKAGKGVTDMDPMIRGKIANLHATLADTYRGVGKYKEAIEEYQCSLRLCPQYKDIRTHMGTAYRDCNQLDRSLKTLQETVKMAPKYIHAQTELGLTYFSLGKIPEARRCWQTVLKNTPNHSMAKTYLNLCKTSPKKVSKRASGKKGR